MKISILDVKIDAINNQLAFNQIDGFLTSNKSNYIVTPNPEIILAAQKSDNLKKILNCADLSLPDGIGLLLASKLKIKHRITGTDVMQQILNNYKNKSFKFILNDKGLSTLDHVRSKTNVQIDEINPDIIFVALGCPAQELWIKNNINNYPSAKIIMTVGGGVDFLTGQQKRAPKFLRSIGLEWLWRLIKQPKRIKRIFNATVVFPLRVIFS